MNHGSVSATFIFEGTHAVADDPSLATPHTRRWSWTVRVGGPLVGPGWVMRWEDLLDRMTKVMPADGELNAWLGTVNATSEKIVVAAVLRLSLPQGVAVVSSELSEESTDEWSVHWP